MDYRRLAVGLTVEHWSDKDVLADGTKVSRYWKQAGASRTPFPWPAYQQVIKQPWAWEVKIFAKTATGDLFTTTVDVKSFVTLKELDELLAEHRGELLEEHPETVADGWRAVIKAAAVISKKKAG